MSSPFVWVYVRHPLAFCRRTRLWNKHSRFLDKNRNFMNSNKRAELELFELYGSKLLWSVCHRNSLHHLCWLESMIASIIKNVFRSVYFSPSAHISSHCQGTLWESHKTLGRSCHGCEVQTSHVIHPMRHFDVSTLNEHPGQFTR